MFAWRRTATRRRVLVNLKTDKAIAGVLWAKRGHLLVLRNAELLEAGRQPTKLDGEVVFERSNVDFLQVVTPTEA
jgi:small nuclear ribonucleoprotein (snRNP)-like protein